MIVGFLPEKEDPNELRSLILPEHISSFTKKGFKVLIPNEYSKIGISDDIYKESGAEIKEDTEIAMTADLLFKLSGKNLNQYSFKEKSVLTVAFFEDQDEELKNILKNKGVSLFALNLLPRITRAQAMDVLSSQSNLAGYKSVIDTAYEFDKALPMMMTAAGTITPAKYFIIGAGVAGLQAIATAKRLGAVVSATDVRLASKEQVESLGAKFVFVESDEQLETEGGYAKEATDEYKKKQEKLLRETIKNQDVVITTALIPGKKAPKILDEEMVKSMKPGSVICDLATSQGGNVAFSVKDKITYILPQGF